MLPFFAAPVAPWRGQNAPGATGFVAGRAIVGLGLEGFGAERLAGVFVAGLDVVRVAGLRDGTDRARAVGVTVRDLSAGLVVVVVFCGPVAVGVPGSAVAAAWFGAGLSSASVPTMPAPAQQSTPRANTPRAMFAAVAFLRR